MLILIDRFLSVLTPDFYAQLRCYLLLIVLREVLISVTKCRLRVMHALQEQRDEFCLTGLRGNNVVWKFSQFLLKVGVTNFVPARAEFASTSMFKYLIHFFDRVNLMTSRCTCLLIYLVLFFNVLSLYSGWNIGWWSVSQHIQH